jgi:hypothetical protein
MKVMTYKERIKAEHDLMFKPRVLCLCGWLNYKPKKEAEPFARCKQCGKLIDKKYYFIEQVTKEIKKYETKIFI